MHITQFIDPRVARGDHADRIPVLDEYVIHILKVPGAFLGDGNEISAAAGPLPYHLEGGACGNGCRTLQCGFSRFLFYGRGWCLDLFDGCKQGIAQRGGIACGQEKPSGLVCEAPQATLLLFGEVKTNDVHGKVHTAHGQLFSQFTRVAPTGLQAVTHQDNSGAL